MKVSAWACCWPGRRNRPAAGLPGVTGLLAEAGGRGLAGSPLARTWPGDVGQDTHPCLLRPHHHRLTELWRNSRHTSNNALYHGQDNYELFWGMTNQSGRFLACWHIATRVDTKTQRSIVRFPRIMKGQKG